MRQSDKQGRFEELTSADQHTVDTYIDELFRRDTLVDQVLDRTGDEADDAPRDSRIYAIPSAESDRRGAMGVLRARG